MRFAGIDVRWGTTSLSSSKALAVTSWVISVMPVTFPPGWARLATSPYRTTSPTPAIYDRELAAGLPSSEGRRVRGDDQDIDMKPHQLDSQLIESFHSAVGVPAFDGDVLPFDPAPL